MWQSVKNWCRFIFIDIWTFQSNAFSDFNPDAFTVEDVAAMKRISLFGAGVLINTGLRQGKFTANGNGTYRLT